MKEDTFKGSLVETIFKKTFLKDYHSRKKQSQSTVMCKFV